MANTFNYRSGKVVPRKWAVESATVIEKGDMLWADIDSISAYAKPASAFTWDTNIATTQASFAALFIGIALESSASGQTDPISVDMSSESVYEMTVPSGTYYPDDTFGPDKDTGNAMLDQVLESAASTSSIAKYAEKSGSSRASTTKLRVTFAPALTTNSSNVNANIG